MKTRNMPEKVTLRRARAFYRIHGEMPSGVESLAFPSDMKFRKGRNHRMKAPMKFLGLTPSS